MPKRLNTTRCTFAIALASVVFAAQAYAVPPLRPDIKVGYLTDLSGAGAFYGPSAVRGATLAVERARAEGTAVSLVVGDHRFKTADAVSEATRLLKLEKVDALVVEFSPASIAVAPLIASRGTLAVTMCAATSHLARTPTAFRSYLDYDRGCREVGRYWREKKVERLGILKSNTEFGEICLRGVRQSYPDVVVRDFTIGEDLQSQVLSLKKSQVQAIVVAGLEGDAENALKSMLRLDFVRPIANSEPDLFTPHIVSAYGNALEGSISFGFALLPPQFLEELRLNGELPPIPSAAALAYLHVRQLIDAIKGCAQGDIDCEKRALERSPGSTILGFKGWREREAVLTIHLREWRGGKLETAKVIE